MQLLDRIKAVEAAPMSVAHARTSSFLFFVLLRVAVRVADGEGEGLRRMGCGEQGCAAVTPAGTEACPKPFSPQHRRDPVAERAQTVPPLEAKAFTTPRFAGTLVWHQLFRARRQAGVGERARMPIAADDRNLTRESREGNSRLAKGALPPTRDGACRVRDCAAVAVASGDGALRR